MQKMDDLERYQSVALSRDPKLDCWQISDGTLKIDFFLSGYRHWVEKYSGYSGLMLWKYYFLVELYDFDKWGGYYGYGRMMKYWEYYEEALKND